MLNIMDTESLLAKLIATVILLGSLGVGAYAAGYVVGHIQAHEPTQMQKVTQYLQKHYPDYIRRQIK